MKLLHTGKFFGQTNKIIRLNEITLTDTEYTHPRVGWHCHENAYFTFILQGNLIEGNKKELYNCSAGSLLFHNWQEPHYNQKPEGYTRGFHIEFHKSLFDNFYFDINDLQGSFSIENPDIKLLAYKIFQETNVCDDVTKLSVQEFVLKALNLLVQTEKSSKNKKPVWVDKIKDILCDRFSEKITLEELSKELDIHPVHLSRDFSKYFYCNLGEYIRKIRVAKALSLFPNKKLSLTQIAFNCGFADQSHFLRCFKEMKGINPSVYRKFF